MNGNSYPITEASCVIRGTNAGRGRTCWLAPKSKAVQHLHYGRIILDATDPPVSFPNGNHETGLICLKGGGAVRVDGSSFEFGSYDAVYIPRDSEIEVSGPDGCDFAEFSAPVEHRYPLRFVSFADVERDPGLHFKAGGVSSSRDVHILIGKNLEAGRIVAGVTFSAPGNWTSWPPHEHAAMLEEAYVFIDMPAPAWGLQFVYTDPKAPELAVVVRDGDCVVIPRGYHPNVAAPGGSVNFLWIMAAHREGEDRRFGVVNVQPEYASAGSGIEAGR